MNIRTSSIGTLLVMGYAVWEEDHIICVKGLRKGKIKGIEMVVRYNLRNMTRKVRGGGRIKFSEWSPFRSDIVTDVLMLRVDRYYPIEVVTFYKAAREMEARRILALEGIFSGKEEPGSPGWWMIKVKLKFVSGIKGGQAAYRRADEDRCNWLMSSDGVLREGLVSVVH